jgi:hypothetical protein
MMDGSFLSKVSTSSCEKFSGAMASRMRRQLSLLPGISRVTPIAGLQKKEPGKKE